MLQSGLMLHNIISLNVAPTKFDRTCEDDPPYEIINIDITCKNGEVFHITLFGKDSNCIKRTVN